MSAIIIILNIFMFPTPNEFCFANFYRIFIITISAYTGSVITDVELEANKRSSFFHFK